MKRRPPHPPDAAPTDDRGATSASRSPELGQTVTDSAPDRDGPTLVQRARSLAEGAEFDGLRIVRLVDVGGWGAVFAATELAAAQQVALKVPRKDHVADPRASQRFLREIEIVKSLRHPAVMRVLGSGHTPGGRPYMTMEWHDGEPLSALLKREGALAVDTVVTLAERLCDALGFAHQSGVVHRDLKPGNVMVGPGAADQHVKLLDFGIARFLGPAADEQGLTKTGELLGTPQTMAPEQLTGQAIDHRVDVYALGATLFRMLTGRYPFEAATFAELREMHLEVAPPRASDSAPVSRAMDEVILRCLAKQPGDRFASVGEVAEALRHAIAGAPSSAPRRAQRATLGVAITVSSAAGPDDEQAFDERMELLDLGAEQLEAEGFTVIAESAERIVLGQALPAAGDEQRRAVVQALARLRDWLASPQAATHARHRLAAAVHIARAAGAGPEAAERSLRQDLEDWASTSEAALTLSHSATTIAEGAPSAGAAADDAIHPRQPLRLAALATLINSRG